jgi:hypothetical protein
MTPQPEPRRTRPNSWSINRWSEYRRIVQSLDFFGLPPWARHDIMEAVHDEKAWDWYTDCDGCTAVSEPGWPSKYFPPCVRHDYDWQTGRGGWESNARFRRLNKLYHMDGWRANLRWFGVSVAWYGWYKWTR